MLENSQGRTRPENNPPVFPDPNSTEFTGGTLKCFMDCSLRNIGTDVDIVDDPIHKLIEELLATDNLGRLQPGREAHIQCFIPRELDAGKANQAAPPPSCRNARADSAL